MTDGIFNFKFMSVKKRHSLNIKINNPYQVNLIYVIHDLLYYHRLVHFVKNALKYLRERAHFPSMRAPQNGRFTLK
jgi:hypothetical protein